ncbi:MAG TPA: TolC family protein, partial [Pyrinomonadaceae bacterium]
MHDSIPLRGSVRAPAAHRFLVVFWTLTLGLSVLAQSAPEASVAAARDAGATAAVVMPPVPVNRTPTPSTGRPTPTVALYFDPLQGTSSGDLVQRALSANAELAAARLEIARARARLRQAGLRPNPTIDFEQTTGRLTGSAGESETSVGVSLPLELGGRRGRRIELARAELEAVEAEVAERERRLTGEVLAAYAESLSTLRELEITEGLTDLDVKTVVFVQARVSEGDTAPLELSLLQAEVERLRSKRALVEGRLRSSLVRLKMLAGILPNEIVKLREDINEPSLLLQPPTSM